MATSDPTDDAVPPPRGTRRRAAVAAVAMAAALVVGAVAAAAALRTGDTGDDATTTPADPRQDVALVGDSLIEQSSDQFLAHAADRGLTVETSAFGGSAPCDWMEVFERHAAEPPRQLVISFAGNDNTPCIHPGGGPPRDPQTIADAYAAIMPGIVDLYAGTDTELFVVVPPPVGEPASEPAAVAIRAMYRDLAAARPEVTLVDPAPLLGPDGQFHLTLPCEAWEASVCGPDGTVAVRNPDGIHLTPAGGERYARTLLDALGVPVAG